jgi:hypothetical protein
MICFFFVFSLFLLEASMFLKAFFDIDTEQLKNLPLGLKKSLKAQPSNRIRPLPKIDEESVKEILDNYEIRCTQLAIKICEKRFLSRGWHQNMGVSQKELLAITFPIMDIYLEAGMKDEEPDFNLFKKYLAQPQ